nr:M57 family metalloprotease [Corallococcus exiguus]
MSLGFSALREFESSQRNSENEFAQGFIRGAERRALPTGRALLFYTGLYSRLSQGLDLAIGNYNSLGLTFTMARGPTTGCNANITATITSGAGGSSGFPSGGLPYGTINIGTGLQSYSVDVNEHVITHEIGHTIGFRHSDYYNRAISCGGSASNEGTAGVGAILISGTPSTATVGGSIMNSCFRSTETGEWTSSDITALTTIY